MIVQINPIKKRAKERIKTYGNEMELLREDYFRGEKAILVKSIKESWIGWFTLSEVSFKKME